jgi:FkbM family methyltransferase
MIQSAANLVKQSLPAAVREKMWRLRYLPRKYGSRLVATVRYRDLLTALRASYGEEPSDSEYTLAVRGYPKPVRLRARTSDFAVFRQVFLERQYGRLPVREPRIIIDAGANIGLASLYFLHQYPGARIIAIEPDPENLAIAEKNLKAFRNRCTIVRGALWSGKRTLQLKRVGAHWETQVVTSAEGSSIQAYSLADLANEYSFSSIDLLKIDIEGAEEEVFRRGGPAVFDRVSCCAIELHGPTCETAFRSAAAPHRFVWQHRGELTIVSRRQKATYATSRLPE